MADASPKKLSKIIHLISKQHRVKYLCCMLFSVFNSSLELITAFIVMLVAGSVSNPQYIRKYLFFIPQSYSDQTLIFISISMFVFISIMKNIFTYTEAYIQNQTTLDLAVSFRKRILDLYCFSNYERFLVKNSAYFIHLIRDDADYMFKLVIPAYLVIFSEVVVLFFLTIAVILVYPVVSLGLFTYAFLLTLFFKKVIMPVFHARGSSLQSSSVNIQKEITEFIHGFKEIYLSGKQDFFVNKFGILVNSNMKVYFSSVLFSLIPRMLLETSFVAILSGIVIYFYSVAESTESMLSLVGIYLYVGFRLIPSINKITTHSNNISMYTASVDRVYHEYNFLIKEKKPFTFEKNKLNFNEIKFFNVSYRYPNSSEFAIKNINLTIKKGDVVGVIGKTGSGKSTFISLLLGLLQPTSGYIEVNNCSLSISKSWLKQIGYVAQDFYMLDESIASNIVFGDTVVDDDKIAKLLKLVKLDDKFRKVGKRIYEEIGDRGCKLSGGEKQRLAIARSLYRDPSILILDEATSALDLNTEREILENLAKYYNDITILFVTHRESSLKYCHKVIDLMSYSTCKQKSSKLVEVVDE